MAKQNGIEAYMYLACRDYGHGWEDYPEQRPTREKYRGLTVVKRWVVCMRCLTIRTERVAVDGMIVTRSYDYPSDYLAALAGLDPRTPRREYRKAAIAALNLHALRVVS